MKASRILMSNSRYTEEFKRNAVVQISGRGYSVQEVSERLLDSQCCH